MPFSHDFPTQAQNNNANNSRTLDFNACNSNDNTNNNNYNFNTTSIPETNPSIECTNIQNTTAPFLSISESTSSSQTDMVIEDKLGILLRNIIDHSESISKSNSEPNESLLDLSTDYNIDSFSSQSTHQMITRSKLGIVKPNPKYSMLTNCPHDNDPKKLSDAFN